VVREPLRRKGPSLLEENPKRPMFSLEPQITPRNTSFARNYICKCNVNVNRGHWFTITLHLQGLFRHLHVIGVNDGLQPFLTVAGVSCAQNRLRQLIYVHIAS
jgi:hypothetical protein